jgi:septum formation protein
MKMPIVLASASPRRQELLGLLTDDFRVCPADADETPGAYQTPAEYALAMAVNKAIEVSHGVDDIVLGADTVVCMGAKILGKPVDQAENIAMLASLAGRWHGVITAVALCQDGKLICQDIVTTRVLFSQMQDHEIVNYVNSKDGLDKAGGYGIQGDAGKFVAGIDGCYYNVVGLPVAAVAKILKGHI